MTNTPPRHHGWSSLPAPAPAPTTPRSLAGASAARRGAPGGALTPGTRRRDTRRDGARRRRIRLATSATSTSSRVGGHTLCPREQPHAGASRTRAWPRRAAWPREWKSRSRPRMRSHTRERAGRGVTKISDWCFFGCHTKSVARFPPRRGFRRVRAAPNVRAAVVHAVREVPERDRERDGYRADGRHSTAGRRSELAHLRFGGTRFSCCSF